MLGPGAGRPQPEGHAEEERHGGGLAGHREKRPDFGCSTGEDVRAPEVERHGRELERQSDGHHQPADRQRQPGAPRHPHGIERRQFAGHGRQVAGAEDTGQKAQAVEHDPRRPGPVDGVLEGRLRTRLAPFEESGEGVRGNTRHLHRHKHHEEMIGRRHQAHAERRPENEGVEIGPILAVRDPGNLREEDEEHEESGQQQTDVSGQRVEGEQATEQFLPPRQQIADGRRPSSGAEGEDVVPGEKQREEDAAEGDETGVDQTEERHHPAEQQQNDGRRQTEFRTEMGQRHDERVVERAIQQSAEIAVGIHRPPPTEKESIAAWNSAFSGSVEAAAPAGAEAPSWPRVHSASVSTCRFTVGVT